MTTCRCTCKKPLRVRANGADFHGGGLMKDIFRKTGLAASVAIVAACVAQPSSAAVTITYGEIADPGFFGASFTLTLPDYIFTNTGLDASALTSCQGGGSSPSTCSGIDFFTDGLPDTSNSFTLHTTTGNVNVSFSTSGTFSQNGTSSAIPSSPHIQRAMLTVGGSPSTSSAVPELATWAMMLLGLGVVGASMRKACMPGAMHYSSVKPKPVG